MVPGPYATTAARCPFCGSFRGNYCGTGCTAMFGDVGWTSTRYDNWAPAHSAVDAFIRAATNPDPTPRAHGCGHRMFQIPLEWRAVTADRHDGRPALRAVTRRHARHVVAGAARQRRPLRSRPGRRRRLEE